MGQGGEVRYLASLISWRTQVQILPLQPSLPRRIHPSFKTLCFRFAISPSRAQGKDIV